MKTLFWVPPWGSQGNPLFYRNSVRKHLIPQANLLSDAGFEVEFVLPALLESEAGLLDSKIRIIRLPASAHIELTGSVKDPSATLYSGQNYPLVERIIAKLCNILSQRYDVILLWETPVPFLEIMYPDALIIHQMPGVFSRPPYPHTVTFDPIGLFKNGSLYTLSSTILATNQDGQDISLARTFAQNAKQEISRLQAIDPAWLRDADKYSKLVLLPLQVTKHYNFRIDTHYEDQSDFLFDVLSGCDECAGIIVTQYVTPNVKDTILNDEIASTLKDKYANMIYSSEFDRVSGVSQYLLPIVDEVITCSSSIGLQGMVWQKKLNVFQPTFLQPFSFEASSKICSWADACDRVLSFLLARNQPLASAILTDQQFAVSLLEEMLGRKRSGASGLDLLPRLSEIREGYEELLCSSFRTGRAAKELGTGNPYWSAREGELRKFRKVMRDPSIKVITFDIFDTLIQRATERPVDVFKFLEARALEITGGIAQDFARVREVLEKETRSRLEPIEGEITIDDIYDAIGEYYGLEDSAVEKLKEEEIELEVRLSIPRRFGKALWEEAVASGKEIYLLSDMYLPLEVVKRLLAKAGYSEYREIYLSSMKKCQKRTGALFQLFLNDKNVAAVSVFHIGDNKNNDVRQPESKGIRAMRWSSAIDWQRANLLYKEIYSPKTGVGGRARSLVAGLTAQALFDDPGGKDALSTLFNGQPSYLGYAALGPMYVAYVLWLGRQVVRDEISHLYFLSREGWLFKQMYDELFGGMEGSVPSSYLYTSRRAARVAGLKTRGDVWALATHPFDHGVTLSELISNRFGVSPTVLTDDVLAEAGFANKDAPLERDATGRIRFAKVCMLLAERILEQADLERRNYLVYLEKAGMLGASKPAVVDLGWKGNIQGALGDLLGRGLFGYYYVTLQGAELWTAKGHVHRGFAGDYVTEQHHPSAAVRNRKLLEYLTCHVEPSLVRMESDGDRCWPIFRSEPERIKRRMLIEEIHRGAISFARDVRSYFGCNIQELFIDPYLAERVFDVFATNPTPMDAAMFVGCSFEDAVAGVDRKYIISPKANASVEESVWQAGAQALRKVGKAAAAKKMDNVAPKRKEDTKSEAVRGANTGTGNIINGELQKNLNGHSGVNFLGLFERRVVEALLDGKKRRKYERDRDAFFLDSKSRLARAWYRLTAA